MADDDVNTLTGKVDEIGRKLDVLSATVDARFTQVDARFAEVDRRFDAVDARFAEVDRRFDAVDARFAEVDVRLDRQFAEVGEHFAEQRQYIEFGIDSLRTEMRSGFQRLEDTLDRFIDTQDGINRDLDRRLRKVEGARRRRSS